MNVFKKSQTLHPGLEPQKRLRALQVVENDQAGDKEETGEVIPSHSIASSYRKSLYNSAIGEGRV